MNAPPNKTGYDAPAWSPALARTHLEETFGITYSREHCRRLLHEAGLSVQTARPISYEADPDAQRRWREEFKKKWPRLKDEGYQIVAIDQHSEAVATNQKPTWFPVNSRPRLPVSGARGKVNMLDAVTDDDERFVALTPNQFNAEVAKHFLRALQHEFGEKLAIVLDNAPYFIAKTLKKQAAGDGCFWNSCRRIRQS